MNVNDLQKEAPPKAERFSEEAVNRAVDWKRRNPNSFPSYNIPIPNWQSPIHIGAAVRVVAAPNDNRYVVVDIREEMAICVPVCHPDEPAVCAFPIPLDKLVASAFEEPKDWESDLPDDDLTEFEKAQEESIRASAQEIRTKRKLRVDQSKMAEWIAEWEREEYSKYSPIYGDMTEFIKNVIVPAVSASVSVNAQALVQWQQMSDDYDENRSGIEPSIIIAKNLVKNLIDEFKS